MKSKKKLGELVLELLHELYQDSEPPLDFLEFHKKVEETGECEKDWFMQHEISEADYVRIRDAFYKKHKLTKRERKAFAWELLNYSPKFKKEEMK